MSSIVYEFMALAVNALRNNPRLRTWLIGVLLIVFLAVLFLLFTASFWIQDVQFAIRQFAAPVLATTGMALLVTITSFTKIDFARRGVDVELESLRDEREKIQKRMEKGRSSDAPARETVLDTIQLSLNQITEYYTINKSQARNSFTLSVFAIVAGLLTIVSGVWIFYFGQKQDTGLTLISGVAGTLIEFIGAAYFYLYNRSLSQLNFFYEKLVRMQDTMLAIQLCESLTKDKQIEMKEKLILALMERSSLPLVTPNPVAVVTPSSDGLQRNGAGAPS